MEPFRGRGRAMAAPEALITAFFCPCVARSRDPETMESSSSVVARDHASGRAVCVLWDHRRCIEHPAAVLSVLTSGNSNGADSARPPIAVGSHLCSTELNWSPDQRTPAPPMAPSLAHGYAACTQTARHDAAAGWRPRGLAARALVVPHRVRPTPLLALPFRN